ncbi:hypothetical protein CRUP_011312 [Coryphaenoides rupestris]|nr:hypothetical protein CRUP_011312 [Coryphaenoides rupestris]
MCVPSACWPESSMLLSFRLCLNGESEKWSRPPPQGLEESSGVLRSDVLLSSAMRPPPSTASTARPSGPLPPCWPEAHITTTTRQSKRPDLHLGYIVLAESPEAPPPPGSARRRRGGGVKAGVGVVECFPAKAPTKEFIYQPLSRIGFSGLRGETEAITWRRCANPFELTLKITKVSYWQFDESALPVFLRWFCSSLVAPSWKVLGSAASSMAAACSSREQAWRRPLGGNNLTPAPALPRPQHELRPGFREREQRTRVNQLTEEGEGGFLCVCPIGSRRHSRRTPERSRRACCRTHRVTSSALCTLACTEPSRSAPIFFSSWVSNTNSQSSRSSLWTRMKSTRVSRNMLNTWGFSVQTSPLKNTRVAEKNHEMEGKVERSEQALDASLLASSSEYMLPSTS